MAASLIRGSGCGTREWNEDFKLSDAGGNSILKVPQTPAAGEMVINDGSVDMDFRVEGDTNANLLSVDAGLDAVGIGAAPDAKAVLSCVSTTKGFLPPVMTTTQRDAIAAPTAGLVIFNSTTSKLNVRGASAWEAVTSA